MNKNDKIIISLLTPIIVILALIVFIPSKNSALVVDKFITPWGYEYLVEFESGDHGFINGKDTDYSFGEVVKYKENMFSKWAVE